MQKDQFYLHPFYSDLKLNLRAVTAISLGVFLFMLFFTPLKTNVENFDNKLIIQFTYGAITFVLLGFNRILLPIMAPGLFSRERWNTAWEILFDFLFVASNTVAYTFFSRYVAQVTITFHVVIVILLLSITLVVIMVLTNRFHSLKRENIRLKAKQKLNPVIKKDSPPRKVTFPSDNKTDYFQLLTDQILVIKSANNYIEVFYLENGKVKRKLLRSTLKTTELTFQPHPEIIRCHRSCLVNKNRISKVEKTQDGLTVALEHYPGTIHVSRKYALNVKDSIPSKMQG